MGLKDIFGKISGGGEAASAKLEDYVELQIPESEARFAGGMGKLVKVLKLKGYSDVDSMARELSDGNIVILDVKPLAERSMTELKHAVDEIKEICLSMGGDIAGLSDYHLILTPPSVKIERSAESRAEDFEDTMERVKRGMFK